jgi:LacI family transcriptional regulator
LTQLRELTTRLRGGPQEPGPRSGATLSVEVRIGVPADSAASAAIPRILKGICDRAELEARGRPEIGSIRIAVRCQAPGELRAGTADSKSARTAGDDGDRRGSILLNRFPEEDMEAILRGGCAVSVLEDYKGLAIDVIDTDDEAAISSLVGSLHSAGHTRIGFLSADDPAGGNSAGRRFNGFARGLAARGLGLNRERVLHAGDGPRMNPARVSEKAARAIMVHGATAFVCASDDEAYALIQGLRARGIRVPEDCSLTGSGGLEAPPGLPRATSVRVALEHIGSSALTRMINRIMYPSSPPRKILVNAQPVPGETIVAPRQP